MKVFIKDVDYKNNAFSCIIGKKKTYFYLTNRLAKIFMNSLDTHTIVDFVITPKSKVINRVKHHQVKHFNYIRNYKFDKVIYDHKKLKKDMKEFLNNQRYLLFLDLEMTMPNYYERNFIPEIIQYGYYLVDSLDGSLINSKGNYLKLYNNKKINKQTIRFLNLKVGEYHDSKIEYSIFYNEIKNILNVYNPKIVVWGKNDIKALDYSYQIHNVTNLTDNNSFIDLLKLHKDYFNLSNDLGLFNAYKTYYRQNSVQLHDAKSDAKVTKRVFNAFITYVNEEGNIDANKDI